MKKIVFIFTLFIAMGANAQNSQIKLDLLDILVMRTLDVSYEKQLNDEASIGLSVFINFEDKDTKFRYNEDFQITPYFRQYITTSNGFDVFGELFGSLNFGETDEKTENGLVVEESKNYSDFALGLGAGAKHVSKNGYVFEFNAGIGRNLFNAKVSRQFVPRFGISVGKQF
ncbi:hypothetical protein FHR24_000363 [Wenyingzhuangia heitensis]|uniref:DUF3575 domain-containing protein n=1 Tax=Wenyingzhuangia heitensis TaxID=1487859 RepID=A0ABX0U4Z1_9FLAO|nr:DUF3575 domain-containing protein [Wenyingzhuangia heitensis]NIJ43924.1 hypothetical protein [Wenyingzhuangia heitensis]